MDSLDGGQAFTLPIARGLSHLLGRKVSRDGLSHHLQPSYPGVRTFIVEPRLAPDRAVELSLVGVSRDGRPVWTGERAFVLGRDGSLEVHRGFDRIEPEFQHRSITTDLLHRELELLEVCRRGPSSRLTIDAEGVGRFLCALHGFVFADETDEGPPVRSNRPFAPEGDREALVEAACAYLEEQGSRAGFGRIAIEGAQEAARSARSAWDLARLSFPGEPVEWAEPGDQEDGATEWGREFLLGDDAPPWRAAIYLTPRDYTVRERGEAFRRRRTENAARRLYAELEEAKENLRSSHRPDRIRGLEVLAQCGSVNEDLSDVQTLSSSSDRRVAGVARRVARMMDGADLVDRMTEFGLDRSQDPDARAHILRVLAEHYPDALRGPSALLRVDPDARLQRSMIPMVAAAPQGTAEMAAMLAANPAAENREGLAELRLELMERLAEAADPMTLPVLLEQYHAGGQDPAETLALSRALVTFTDPRARMALAEAMRASERPPLP